MRMPCPCESVIGCPPTIGCRDSPRFGALKNASDSVCTVESFLSADMATSTRLASAVLMGACISVICGLAFAANQATTAAGSEFDWQHAGSPRAINVHPQPPCSRYARVQNAGDAIQPKPCGINCTFQTRASTKRDLSLIPNFAKHDQGSLRRGGDRNSGVTVFPDNKVPNATGGARPAPLELKIMAVLKHLAYGGTWFDLRDTTGIAGETLRRFADEWLPWFLRDDGLGMYTTGSRAAHCKGAVQGRT